MSATKKQMGRKVNTELERTGNGWYTITHRSVNQCLFLQHFSLMSS